MWHVCDVREISTAFRYENVKKDYVEDLVIDERLL